MRGCGYPVLWPLNLPPYEGMRLNSSQGLWVAGRSPAQVPRSGAGGGAPPPAPALFAQLLGGRGPLGLPGGPNRPKNGLLCGTLRNEISSRRAERGAWRSGVETAVFGEQRRLCPLVDWADLRLVVGGGAGQGRPGQARQQAAAKHAFKLQTGSSLGCWTQPGRGPPDREPQTGPKGISTGPVTAVGFASINAEIRTELEKRVLYAL
jgi:hypothetical protein